MIPLRSYLLRAVYDWTLDNNLTPHLLVNAEADEVQVPADFIQEGKITLNIHPQAVKDLELGKDWVRFSARFAGQRRSIEVPMPAVLAIYARENGRGIVFQEEAPEPSPRPPAKPDTPGKAPAGKRPTLKRVK